VTSFDDVLSQIRPREVTETISTREDLVGRIREANKRLAEARAYDREHNTPDTAPAVKEELDRLAQDYEAGKVTFTFRSLPHDQWMDLLAKNPPEAEDKAVGRDYNAATFPVAAMAASCVQPEGVTEDKIRDLASKLPHGPFQALFEACMAANLAVEDESIPFSAAAIGAILDFAPSSTTAANTESPTASSPGE